MRPIAYGLLVFIASGLVWALTSFGAAVESLQGQAGSTWILMYVSGIVFFLGLPAAIAAEIYLWWRCRKATRKSGED